MPSDMIRIKRALAIMVAISGLIRVLALGALAQQVQPPALTEAGQRLEAGYAARIHTLKSEIEKALPPVDQQKTAAYFAARTAEKSAEAAFKAAQDQLGKVGGAQALVDHAKGKWIGGAETGIAAAEAALKKATTEAEREAAQKDLANCQKNKEDGLKALKEREEALAAAKREEPKWIQAHDAAQKALAEAQANKLTAGRALLADTELFLSSDTLDAKLARCAVLVAATPRGLAEFAQQGSEQEALVEKLLADSALMDQMLEAGGAKAGKYGPAIKIYTDILKASPRAREGFGQRLALATSLEHAVPIRHESWTTEYTRLSKKPPSTIVLDPVQRYLHYEKACLDGELDPAFTSLTTWEYRHIVNSDATDDMLAWGREMLRNYRPDHIFTTDDGWRYTRIVRTDVTYLHSWNFKDSDELAYFQNVIKNGGICGRRALFARFILQCFGNPTWGVYQHAHAATGRWTPAGWVVNLGAGWDQSWGPKEETGSSRRGADFLLETQARKYSREYRRVLRAQWVGAVMGEPTYDSTKEGSGSLWNAMAQIQKKVMVAEAKPVQLAALGVELGEVNESAEIKAATVVKAEVTDADKRITVDANGVITIPVAACGGVQPVKSFLGGLQAFCGDSFTCEVDVSNPGKYQITARVVTVGDAGTVQMTANNTNDAVDIAIPYTCGKWEQSQPVEVTLVQGRNALAFSKPARGFSLKHITLTPVN